MILTLNIQRGTAAGVPPYIYLRGYGVLPPPPRPILLNKTLNCSVILHTMVTVT